MATAERKLGPLTWPAAVEAWKYSTRVAVRSYETFVWVYREIKAYRCVDRVITKLVLGYRQPGAFSRCGESLRAMGSFGEL